MFTPMLAVFLTAMMVPAVVQSGSTETAESESYEESINDWRQRRHERLASEDGWMTLVGLEWLHEGENRIGDQASSTIRIPGGPADWGTLYLEDAEIRFVTAPGSSVTVDDSEVDEAVLVADNQGEPSVVRQGDLSFHVIFRESYAVRVKDRKAPALLEYSGMPTYDIRPDWRFNARFIPAAEGETIEVGNVLGQLSPTSVYGYIEFEYDGKTYRLMGLGDEDAESLWFLFADRTTGKETYGAGRFLYSDGLPEEGRVVVDFNKAYNPPCAFNDYSTCPLPPQQNRLDVAVTAGEKDYHAHHD